MSRNRGQNTKPEVILRKSLWSQGFRYRLNVKLPGKPDLVFQAARVAVFVDGCFWHGCVVHKKPPKTNVEFWACKISKNVERDKQVNLQLAELGWTVLRFWEHEIKCDLSACTQSITLALRKHAHDGKKVKAR